MLPANAVVRDGKATFVWVVRDGEVEKRTVELGKETAGGFPVLKGLEGGESVVVDSPRRLRDGAVVELEGA
jgi:multidrug efflux pump subunit AcrA (membrane-fusion protein)